MNEVTSTAFGYSGEAVRTAHEIRRHWQATGLTGGFHARNLDTGEELGFEPDRAHPLASVVKLPLALVVLDQIERGTLRADLPVEIDPGGRTDGPTGISSFRHSCTIALEDLLTMMLAVSDNAAADAVFDLVAPRTVTDTLSSWDCRDVLVRHPVRTLYDAMSAVAADDRALALELAIGATTGGGGHVLPALDIASASCGTARGLVTLLGQVWSDSVSVPAATGRLRQLMAAPLTSRIAREVASDTVRVSSKSGTFFNLRHEAGVVSTSDGDRIAVAALTASSVPALLQPEADRAIGLAARDAVDVLRL